MNGHPAFIAALDELKALHVKKQADYGTDEDPFANVRSATEFGIYSWIGAAIRLNDKVTRLKTMAKKKSLANESIEDSFIDIAAYALIALVLYRESVNDKSSISPDRMPTMPHAGSVSFSER